MGNILNKSRMKKSSLSKSREITINAQNEEKQELQYFLPNIVEDTDVMVTAHFLCCHLFQGILNAPIGNKLTQEDSKILDVGCGSGAWLLDLASIYNLPNFFGIDLFPIYPTGVKPKNVEFKQGDILNGLPYGDNTFDYVHQGDMSGVFTMEEWDFIIQELIRVCKPGGYIELTEPDLSKNAGPILKRFYDGLTALNDSRNVKVRIFKDVMELLESIPTVKNIDYKIITVSLGAKRGGNAGQAYMDIHNGFFLNEPMPESMCKFMGISQEEYFELYEEAKNEVASGISPDCDIYRMWCQKV